MRDQRQYLSNGMDAFMEFERDMARKRRKDNEKLLDYELSLQSQERRKKPERPAPKYHLSLYPSRNDEKLLTARQKLLIDDDRAVFEIKANNVISAPHKTTEGALRTVHHIDINVRDDQQELVCVHASNIGVYKPNDLSVVEQMVDHLREIDLNVMYVAEPLPHTTDKSQQQISLQRQTFQYRPFACTGSVLDALTWKFDLESTPRPSFLRDLAAYASEENDVAALMLPQTAEAIQAESRHHRATIADVFKRFPSVRLSFADFFQIAPYNFPRYYTVSSSRQFVPDTVSITLGLRETSSLPPPRCSTYLAMLKPGDRVRACFYQSSFVFPFHNKLPIMLVGAGTGIAPFRAFLQDLEHENQLPSQQHRPAYLFYGCRDANVDFLYGNELQRALDSGVLNQLHVEFSDNHGCPKRYVQDALLDHSELVARHLLKNEGYIYVCGSFAMGRAVKKAIVTAILNHPEFLHRPIVTKEDAEQIVSQKLARRLIVTELW
ncbi:NADP/FAD dependent oxidoreductase [Plasmopara halstedii]|uniref:NADPH--hemoprotein reductase n=1 Tax=Plasmopara halstedii TaxID=4781 RepID=A0A0P1ASC5_PLAHL|nr:NADP/FAD dependent oxidoreductase [Plasmopara halstedii]CEG43789.1 NADP/FAD dependent oxidoreductase [Plasmopara halstedii]|eukprot:XP_024580158.1 NADP/FAD dependent oxidoreductase [Plasmopara halstedii]